MDKMYLDALSVFREYITDFVEEIEVKLGTQTWNEVRNAIRRKRRKNAMDYEQEELVFISQLEILLKGVNKMTVKEFELLMAIKARSNTEFHKGEVTARNVSSRRPTSFQSATKKASLCS